MKEPSFANFCKRLANRERFDVLRQVACAMTDEGLTVGEISDLVRLKQPATSQYLAQLESECGLVRAQREGRYVVYRFAPNPAFAPAVELGPLLGRYFRDEAAAHHFRRGRMDDPPFLRTFDALGNADRARVALFLRGQRSATKVDVQVALKLTELNARRHLSGLCDRGFLALDNPAFRWLEPPDSISRNLLDFCLQPTSHIAISDGA